MCASRVARLSLELVGSALALVLQHASLRQEQAAIMPVDLLARTCARRMLQCCSYSVAEACRRQEAAARGPRAARWARAQAGPVGVEGAPAQI